MIRSVTPSGADATPPPGSARDRKPRWTRLDLTVAAYTGWTAWLIVAHREAVRAPWMLLAFHLAVLALVAGLPRRGAAWETGSSTEAPWRARLRRAARFFRYTYPALLLTPYFEEVARFVNAIAPETPYWFEPYLYAADRLVFGELPAVWLAGWVGPVQDEIVHAFYFSYYPILIGGLLLAWAGPRSASTRFPGPGFERTITALVLAQFLAFVWYPWLPARGPWENPVLMAGLPPFRGLVFVPVIERIIDVGAVSGGCFPSAHVAGTWAVVLGMMKVHPRPAAVFGVLAVGLSFACVYTRYHHGVDVPAGFLVGLVGAWLASRWTPGARPA